MVALTSAMSAVPKHRRTARCTAAGEPFDLLLLRFTFRCGQCAGGSTPDETPTGGDPLRPPEHERTKMALIREPFRGRRFGKPSALCDQTAGKLKPPVGDIGSGVTRSSP